MGCIQFSQVAEFTVETTARTEGAECIKPITVTL